MNRLIMASVILGLAGCASSSGSVVDKVLQDFGIKDRPEGYVSGSDRALDRLSDVGKGELKRLNTVARHGEVKFESGAGLRGKYYKEVKVYENYYPLEARPSARSSSKERGFAGYIEYAYRVFQSPRKANRAQAQAARATIPTDQGGRETYRYRLNSGSVWNGAKGERVKR